MTFLNKMERTKQVARRHYDDGCATAHALDLIGERWALLVMRELLLGPKRFTDLRTSLPGISANVLTQRLEGLEAAFIVQRRKLPPPAAAWVYELTPWGEESEELFKVIGRWAARSPLLMPGAPMSVSSVVMSMRTMFDAKAARNCEGSIGFRFGEEEFHATLADGTFAIGRGQANGADLLFEGDQNALAAALYGGQSLAALERANILKLIGDRALAERFVTFFPLPEKAQALPACK